jgi:response regulator NasT
VSPERPTVLLAEDEALIRLDLKEMLEEEGYEVVGEAGDGEAALRLARERNPGLVILDIKMPGLDGLSTAERITDEGLAPVIVLTAFSQRELVERAARAGAMAYLVKPFQKSDVVPAIEVALARYEELRALEREVADRDERLEARTLVDRAKGRLMDAYGMKEADAFRFLQKTAMDRRLRLAEVARLVAEGELEGALPPGSG